MAIYELPEGTEVFRFAEAQFPDENGSLEATRDRELLLTRTRKGALWAAHDRGIIYYWWDSEAEPTEADAERWEALENEAMSWEPGGM